jgi:hypothetical protein
VYLINFDKPLTENIIDEIKNSYKDIEEVEVIDKKVSIKLHKSIYIQCVDIRKKLETEHEGIFSGEYPVVINLPGLSLAAVYLVNEIESILRTKPKILELIKERTNDNLFSSFSFRRIFDLDYNLNISRNNIKKESE